jgi:hypothetical protein
MTMGAIPSVQRYEAAADRAPQSANLRNSPILPLWAVASLTPHTGLQIINCHCI